MAKTLPVIDLSSLREDGSGLAQAAEKIGAACRDVGFFYVINHGVDSALMAAAFANRAASSPFRSRIKSRSPATGSAATAAISA